MTIPLEKSLSPIFAVQGYTQWSNQIQSTYLRTNQHRETLWSCTRKIAPFDVSWVHHDGVASQGTPVPPWEIKPNNKAFSREQRRLITYNPLLRLYFSWGYLTWGVGWLAMILRSVGWKLQIFIIEHDVFLHEDVFWNLGGIGFSRHLLKNFSVFSCDFEELFGASEWFVSKNILLMDEILHHLGWLKPYK